MSEWQPIETAPKDGTEIIGAFCRDYGSGNPTTYGPWTIRWNGKEWISSWDGWRVISSQTDFGTDYHDPGIEPTHWVHLPEPPTPPKRNEKHAPEMRLTAEEVLIVALMDILAFKPAEDHSDSPHHQIAVFARRRATEALEAWRTNTYVPERKSAGQEAPPSGGRMDE